MNKRMPAGFGWVNEWFNLNPDPITLFPIMHFGIQKECNEYSKLNDRQNAMTTLYQTMRSIKNLTIRFQDLETTK